MTPTEDQYENWFAGLTATNRKLTRLKKRLRVETDKTIAFDLNEKIAGCEDDITALLREAAEERVNWGFGA